MTSELTAGDKVADILNTLRQESAANLVAAAKVIRFEASLQPNPRIRGVLSGLVVLLKELDETRREGEDEHAGNERSS